jgi:large exoprotein involved in heme utilization and adhesion
LVQDDFGRPLQGGLQVSEGETLALIGDRLHIAGGVMIAPGGRIELGSVGGESSVSLTAIASGWRVGYGDVQNFSDIAFTDTALLDTTAAGNGGWQIQGREIVLTDNSTLTAYTEGSQNGGAALIRGETLELTGRSFISFLTLGAGRSGSLRIGVDRLFIDEGSQIVTATSGAGQGGDLRITASERIALNGGLSTPQFFLNTGLFAQANPDAAETSRAGDITLNTPSLSLQNGAQISTTTFGAADAGDLQIVADRIELSGALLRPNGSLLTEVNGRIYPTGLFTDTDANTSGNGGNLQIDTQRLSLQTGAFLQTNTEGSGRAGDLTIRATESVEVSGRSADGRIPTTLFAASGGLPTLPGGGEQTATGQGGRLQITTAELRVLEGGAIAVTSLNPNLPQTVGAGTLQIRAESIQLNNGGRLLSDSASGNGGNIRLQTQSVIALSRNSQISATAGVDDRPGNGGNINIRTPNGFIIASPQQDNDIIANAFEGRGGNINIDTRGLIGITARRAVPGNQTNDIDASSALGAPGTIRINQTELDPTRGLTELPVATAPPEPLQTCGTPTAGNAGRNRGDRTPTTFFNIGRGGIAPAPDALLESDDITDDIRLRSQSLTVAIDSPVLSSSTSSNLSLNTSSDTSPDLSSGDSMGVEAAGWAIDGAGRVRLMANVPHSEIQGCALR